MFTHTIVALFHCETRSSQQNELWSAFYCRRSRQIFTLFSLPRAPIHRRPVNAISNKWNSFSEHTLSTLFHANFQTVHLNDDWNAFASRFMTRFVRLAFDWHRRIERFERFECIQWVTFIKIVCTALMIGFLSEFRMKSCYCSTQMNVFALKWRTFLRSLFLSRKWNVLLRYS